MSRYDYGREGFSRKNNELKNMKTYRPENYVDMRWRKFPEEKPTDENGDYLCLRKLSKRSKYVDLKIEFYSNTKYPTYNFSDVSDEAWLQCNKHAKLKGPVIYWMPLPQPPK
jgi:hypothetical protein